MPSLLAPDGVPVRTQAWSRAGSTCEKPIPGKTFKKETQADLHGGGERIGWRLDAYSMEDVMYVL
jgi:hypothetical protein